MFSLSSERRGTKGTATQSGGVLQYKLEMYCDTFLNILRLFLPFFEKTLRVILFCRVTILFEIITLKIQKQLNAYGCLKEPHFRHFMRA